jgi:hypothetical protein
VVLRGVHWLAHPDPRAWLIRQFTIGFGFDGSFWSKVPYAVWLALTLVLPLFVAWRRRERFERPAHLCLTCGYDLRYSNDRCPECGERFEACQPVAWPSPVPKPWKRDRAVALWRRQQRSSP